MAQLAHTGGDADMKVKRLEELDLALTYPQSSQLSSDTAPIGLNCHRWINRSASVSSTVGTVPPPHSRSVRSQHGYQSGAPQRNMRANSTGSKVYGPTTLFKECFATNKLVGVRRELVS